MGVIVDLQHKRGRVVRGQNFELGCHLLAIHPETLQVHLHPTLRDTAYRTLHGKLPRVPTAASLRPNPDHCRARLEQCPGLGNKHP